MGIGNARTILGEQENIATIDACKGSNCLQCSRNLIVQFIAAQVDEPARERKDEVRKVGQILKLCGSVLLSAKFCFTFKPGGRTARYNRRSRVVISVHLPDIVQALN